MRIATGDEVLRTVGLNAAHDGSPAVEDAHLAVGRGEIVALLGPNGAGKSTLLQAVLGLLPATGRVLLEGRDVSGLPPHRRASLGVAWIPEEPRVFPTLTVADHVLLAWESAGRPAAGREELWRALPAIRELGPREASRLSGGQRKLVAAAAALVRQPRLLLADDPFLGLHGDSAVLLTRALEAARTRGTAILLAGQDLQLLARLASRAFLLVAGRIVASGDPRDVLGSPEAEPLTG
jgi:branched-chain amino acid transport system ATP-binding protein